MANSIAQLLVKIGLDSSALSAGLDKMSARMKRFGDEMKAAGTTLTLGITAPMVGLGAAALKTAGEMEQASVAFTTLLKSSTAAAEHLKELKQFALTTPFQFTDLTRLSRLMQAYGFTAAEVVPKLRTMGNAVSALGGGSEVLERVIRSMGEIGTRGKITGEQLRELSRAGIPALQAIADKLGVSVSEAQAKITAGMVDAKTASEALLEYMDKRFKGGMEAQSKTLLGLFSNVRDAITFTLTDIGNALVPLGKRLITDYIQPTLNKISELAKEFGKLPKPVQEAGLAVGGLALTLPVVIVAMGSTITNLIVISGAFAKMSAALFGANGLIAGLGATAMAMTGMGAAATAATLTIYGTLLAATIKLAYESWNLVEAEKAAAQAEKDRDAQLNRLIQHLQAVGFNTSELEAKYKRGQLTFQQMLVELRKLAAQHGATVLAAAEANMTNAERNAKALEGLNLRSTAQRKKDLEDARKYYADLRAAGIENQQVMAEAAQRVQAAQEALNGAFETDPIKILRAEVDRLRTAYEKGTGSIQDVMIAQRKLHEAQQVGKERTSEITAIWRKFYELEGDGVEIEERKLEVTRKLYQQVEKTREQAKKSLDLAADLRAMESAAPGFEGVDIGIEAQSLFAMQRALDEGRLGVDKTHTSVSQLATGMEGAESSARTLGEGVKHMAQQSAEAIKTLPAVVQASMASVLTFTGPVETAFEKAAAALHLNVSEISGETTSKMSEAFKTFVEGAKTVEQVNLAWGSFSQTFRKLAQYDLPLAVKAFQTYIDGVKSASEKEIQAARAAGASEDEIARKRTAVQAQLFRDTISFQELRIRAAQDAGQKIAASEFILLDVMKRKLEQQQFNWGEFLVKFVSQIERAATQSISRTTVDAILGGGIVNHQKLDADLKAAQDAYDALVKLATDAADQQMDVQRAYSAWQIAQQRLDAFKGANITAEKRDELQRQVNDAKAAYDRIRQNFITNYRGMTEATRNLKDAQKAATDPSGWARFTGTVKALFEDLGKAALHVIVEELAQIGIGKLIASLGRLIPGIGRVIAQYGAMGAAGKAAGKLIEEAMKRVKEEMDQIITKAPIMGTALTTAFGSATAAAIALSAQLGVIIAQLAAIIIEAEAAAIALRNMAAAQNGGPDFGDYFFGGGGGGFNTPSTLPPGLSEDPFAPIGGIGGPVRGGAIRNSIDRIRGALASMQVPQVVNLVPAVAEAGSVAIRGGDMHVHVHAGNIYGGKQGLRELSNHIFGDQRRRSGR